MDLKGVNDNLAGSLDGEGRFFSQSLAADGECAAVSVAGIDETLREKTRTTGGLVVRSNVFACGRQVADEGRALADLVEVIDIQGMPSSRQWR